MSADHKNLPPNPTATTTAVPPQPGPGIVSNPDGTFTRTIHIPSTPATPDPNTLSPVLSKDLPLNPKNQTWLRIYLPKQALNEPTTPDLKLPLIIYYHGGGFIFLSAASTIIHEFCVKLAVELSAVIVSVDYRLAPEHRLPAAYDDAVEALQWIKNTQERWLTEFADVSNCFLMGTSAGGNIAYHAGLRAAQIIDDLEPLKIKGLILHHPFFGGLERVGSEIGLIKDPVLTVSGADLAWELSLPVGADRDHEYSNPTVGGGSGHLERVQLVGCRVLVAGCHDDPLIDRQIELADMLKEKGLETVTHFGEGYHSMELFLESEDKDLSFNKKKAKDLFGVVKKFISSS